MGSSSSSSTLKNLRGPIDYGYSNARVMAQKSLMLNDETIKGLASAKHLDEYVSLLEHTPYKQDIGKITQTEIHEVEKALQASLINASRLVVEIAPKNTREFFGKFLIMYETEILKFILNKFDDVPVRKASDYDAAVYLPAIGGEIKKFAKEVSEARSREDALSMLKDTKYSFLSRVSGGESNAAGQITSLLDKYFFEELWNSLDGLPSGESGYARKLIGTHIDLLNIITLLHAAISGSKADRSIISASYRLGGRPERLLGKDLQEVSSALFATCYKELVAEGLKNYEKDRSLLKLELAVKKHLLSEYKRAFRGSPFHIGVLISFLKLKEFEVNNLKAIAVSIDNGSTSKDIMELVIT